MRTWPALEVRFAASAADEGADVSRPDLFLAALTDYDAAAVDDNTLGRYCVFFHTREDRDRALDGLREFSPTALDVPDEDWAARSQASLRAVQVGRLIVAPPWDTPAAAPDSGAAPAAARTIVIQPSMGFGTGHHATTRLCLASLQTIDVGGRSVLDVGTGSGVLAIAAHVLGGRPVLAIDDDPDAVQAARENVELNAGTDVHVRVLDLRSMDRDAFDVVLANLTGGLLIQTAARLQDLTRSGGELILSGFMQHEAADVLAAFARCRVRARVEEDEWVCVTLEKSSSS
jgi:ribosomal protein L11 methyltransferase